MVTRYQFFLCLSLYLFLAGPTRAQINRLNGVVVDGTTKEALPFATVFFNSTTNGTTTDQEGRFSIEVDSRFTELVVSYVGYKPLSHSVDLKQLDLSYTFALEPDAQVIEAIEVVAERDAAWYDHLAIFQREFIGTSTFARKTKIQNPEALFFNLDPETLRLEAKAREPLKITNEALGYEIEYNLERFIFDPENRQIYILGYPRFSELEGKRRKLKRWRQNRKRAYKGSTIHFLKSLVEGTLLEDGFELRRLVRLPNPDRPSDEAIAKAREIMKAREKPTVIRRNSPDTIADILSRAGLPRMVAYLDDTLHNYTIDLERLPDKISLSFKNHWQVIYKKEVEDVFYLPPGKLFQNEPPAPQQTSVLSMTTDRVGINPLGILDDPLAILFEGYWAFEKTGTLLPLNYALEAEEKGKQK